MPSIKRTVLLASLLLTTLCLVSAGPTPSSTSSATPAATTSSFPSSGASSYYPGEKDYSNDPSITAAEDANYNDGSNDGTAQPFMGLSKGGQIGLIVGVVLVGILGLGGLVFFYFHRRRSWEREVARRSTMMGQQHVIITEHGEFVRANSYSAAVAGASGTKKSGSPTSSTFSREDIEKSAAAAEESSIGVRSEFGVTRSEFDRETVQEETPGRWAKWGKIFSRRSS